MKEQALTDHEAVELNHYVWTVYKQPVIPNNLMELFHLNPF